MPAAGLMLIAQGDLRATCDECASQIRRLGGDVQHALTLRPASGRSRANRS